jgi:hypothetical protein
MNRPWRPGAVTGIGSLPGTDPGEASRLIVGELPDLPHLPELPDRGPPADLIGRGLALLVDLPSEIAPSGWRLTSRPGSDLRRARDLLAWDLDALEEAADGYAGPVKIQVAGPWTLAAGAELPSGHRIVSDPGAVRDLAASLTEGVTAHLADVARRIPGAKLVLQVDEPALPAVLGGAVPTPSGFGTVRAVEDVVVEQRLRELLSVAPTSVVHCCASDVPTALLQRAGADAIAIDAALVGVAGYDALGEVLEAGLSLWLGVIPSGAAPDFEQARTTVRQLWSAIGFGPDALPHSVVPTPACGLAGLSDEHVRRVLSVLRDVGSDLVDPVELS